MYNLIPGNVINPSIHTCRSILFLVPKSSLNTGIEFISYARGIIWRIHHLGSDPGGLAMMTDPGGLANDD